MGKIKTKYIIVCEQYVKVTREFVIKTDYIYIVMRLHLYKLMII